MHKKKTYTGSFWNRIIFIKDINPVHLINGSGCFFVVNRAGLTIASKWIKELEKYIQQLKNVNRVK